MNEFMFCMKILGSSIMLVSGTFIGYLYGKDITLHCEELYTMKRYFHIVNSEIQYGGCVLQEVLEHVKSQCKNHHKEWLLYIINEIDGCTYKTFERIWKESVYKYKKELRLSFDEQAELIEVGMCLGSVDREQQMMMLALYLDKLEYRINMLQKEAIQKRKIYQLIGVTGSVVLVIILL